MVGREGKCKRNRGRERLREDLILFERVQFVLKIGKIKGIRGRTSADGAP
jgi:hypothetical protein